MNTYDLRKIVEDLRYVVQTGGQSQSGGGFGESVIFLVSFIVAILKLLVVVFVCYILYQILRKGYPRMLLDLITVSFFRQEKLDKLLKEYGFLLKHYKFLVKDDSSWKGANPYYVLKDLIGSEPGLQNKMYEFDYIIQSGYANFKNDDKYYEAFKNMFKYYNIISVNNTVTLYIWPQSLVDEFFVPPTCDAPPIQSKVLQPGQQAPCIAPEMKIHHFSFYEALTNTLLREGKAKLQRPSKGVNMSYDELVAKTFYFDNTSYRTNNNAVVQIQVDQKLKTNYLGDLEKTVSEFKIIAQSINAVVADLSVIPFSIYIRIPEDDIMVAKFVNDYSKYSGYIYNNAIYTSTINYRDIEEYSWYVFEALAGQKYKVLEKQIEPLINVTTQRARTFITTYLTLPYTNKLKFFQKVIFSFPDLVPDNAGLESWEAKRNWFKLNYTPIITFVDKHPIFSHIYFNTLISDSAKKGDIYRKTLVAYERLMCTNSDLTYFSKYEGDAAVMIKNLKVNGGEFKELIGSLFIVHLFFVEYRETITKLYEEQNISSRNFFSRLWKPYKEEIWDRRIMEYYRRVNTSINISKSYGKFLKPWRLLGNFIGSGKSAVSSAFKHGISVPEEPPPETDDSTAGNEQK